MKRRFLLPVALFLFAVPAAADAPIGQYKQFDKDNTVIIDARTGLGWDRNLVRKDTYTAIAASGYCATSVFSDAGGRIPSIKELLSLFDEEANVAYDTEADPAQQYLETKHIDLNAFPKTKVVTAYWSSTEPNGDPSKVWVLDFRTGAMSLRNKSDTAVVRCVRTAN